MKRMLLLDKMLMFFSVYTRQETSLPIEDGCNVAPLMISALK